MALKDVLGHFTPRAAQSVQGDFYVSVNGSDSFDGSAEHPFATLERAQKAVRERKAAGKPVTVCVQEGLYHLDGLTLTREDSGSENAPVHYVACGKVTLSSTAHLDGKDFAPVQGAVKERLKGEAADKVVVADLKKYGLTAKDWGKLCPIGAFGTEDKYDGVEKGENIELFFNGERMTLARYPAEGFLELDAVRDVGDMFEFPEQNYYHDWDNRRNHRGGTYIMDKKTTARVKTWKDTKGIWAYGYFYHDWADSSTPVASFDAEHRSFFPQFVSRYGARKGGLYFFYNVLDELVNPGQWYLDREEGLLYIYPTADLKDAEIEINLRKNSILTLEGASYVSFDGFTLTGACADGITLHGDHCELTNLTVHSMTGYGINIKGSRNIIRACEIYNIGKGGVMLDGGDRETLTRGDNLVDNCSIHDYGCICQMYMGGVYMKGVGNTCSHNEIYNAPHTGIFFYGNDQVVEYNYVHDVVQHSSDAGAIYSGGDWSMQGGIVRYNCLERIGAGSFRPDGIYFDDMLSGQTAYGNVLVDVKKNGFLVGGGFDNKVFNNILVACGSPITYDDRGRDGFVNNGWAIAAVINYDTGCMWKRLRAMPYTNETWAKRYPLLASISTDFNKPDDPHFPVNPAFGEVHDNVVVAADGSMGKMFSSVPTYSKIENNPVYATVKAAGLTEDYVLTQDAPVWKDLPAFKAIPMDKIGRY